MTVYCDADNCKWNKDGMCKRMKRRKTMKDEYVSRQYLLAEYDRQHQGPPGGARKIIEDAPAAAGLLITNYIWETITTQLLGQVHTPVTMDYETSEKMIAAGIKEVMDKWKERLGI